jgi:hypothetical protein
MKRFGLIPICGKCRQEVIGLWRIEVNEKLLCPECVDLYLKKYTKSGVQK